MHNAQQDKKTESEYLTDDCFDISQNEKKF